MDHVPVTLLTGFLGSGKTTLLRRLLAYAAMAETAVIVNEFGEAGLDHLLLREITDDIVLLDSGCLCCSVRDDLVTSLHELRRDRDLGRIPRFRRVAVETTGLADPAPIIQTLITEREVVAHYRLGSLVTTVDATLGAGQLDDHDEAVKQAAMADRLVITKTDLAPASGAALAERLRALNPSATILPATLEAGPDPDELLDLGPSPFDAAPSSDDALRRRAAAYASPRSTDQAPKNGPHRHDERIASFCLEADRPIAWGAFVEWLQLLLASRGANVLRVKGLLNVAGRSTPVAIHGVQHVVYPPQPLALWPGDDRRTRLVFITRDLSRSAVENSFRTIAASGLSG